MIDRCEECQSLIQIECCEDIKICEECRDDLYLAATHLFMLLKDVIINPATE